jgi:hypothetical protein
MSTADIIKLVTNGLIAVALVLFVLFAGMPWTQALAVMAALLVPSSAPAIWDLLKSAANPKGGA